LLAGNGYTLHFFLLIFAEADMRHVCLAALLLFVALLVVPGCLSDADKKQWKEVLKDLRGDNMEMGSHDKH
jgi:hypothetical protein